MVPVQGDYILEGEKNSSTQAQHGVQICNPSDVGRRTAYSGPAWAPE